MEYDKYGRVIKSLSRMSGKTYVGPWTTWLMEYDKYNNLIKRTSYDENGYVVKQIQTYGTYEYI